MQCSCTNRLGSVLAGALAALAGCAGSDPGRAEINGAVTVAKGTIVRVEPAAPLPTEGFGHAVAVSRSALAVTDFLGTDWVHVDTYALPAAAAVEAGTPLRPDAPGDRCFGQALELSADLLVVGVPCADAGTGAAIAYRWDAKAGAWARVATLRPPDGGLAAFGTSLALGPNVLAVGAPYAADRAGRVYVYGRTLALEAVLGAADGAPGDLLGEAVAASGDLLAATAPGRLSADPLTASGRVHVFSRANGAWGETAALAPQTCLPGEASGWAVAAGDGAIAVTGDRFVAHSVHVFEPAPGGWVEADLEEDERGGPDCGFAHALALDGGLLAVGMPTIDGPAGEYRAGAVHLFRRATAGWTRLPPFATGVAGDKVGHALDLSGGVLAVGAPGTWLRAPDGTVASTGSGAAFVLRP